MHQLPPDIQPITPPSTNLQAVERRQRLRLIKDAVARRAVAVGGVSVILAIVLIFFYLLYVVLPLFKPAEAEAIGSFPVPIPDAGQTLHVAIEEQNELGVRFTDQGQAVFFTIHGGAPVHTQVLPLPPKAEVSVVAASDPAQAVVAYGLKDGRALVLKHTYRHSFAEDNRRSITPEIEYPLGESLVEVDPQGQPLVRLAVQSEEEGATLVAVTADGRVLVTTFSEESSFLEDSTELKREGSVLPSLQRSVAHIALDKGQKTLYLIDDAGELHYFDVTDKTAPVLKQRLHLVEAGTQITAVRFLAGGISILVGDSTGRVTQWFPVRDERNNLLLTRIRTFQKQHAAITSLAVEHARKGFAAADANGRVGIYHATAHRTLLVKKVARDDIRRLALSPRADALLAEDGQGQLHAWSIENEHPEVSWSALWGKVWYESYDQPDYIWQSSSASNDFEPKFSLVPLSFGTIKAAFYAMLVAVPLSILGALYTAYFMSARMRRVVKPSIEIMEALPTVILGFLAGLWLAPLMEKHLPGVFSLLVVMPFGLLLFAFLWSRLPLRLRAAVPDGWEAALLILPVILIGWLAMATSPAIEAAFFGGDMRSWLTNELGIDFDQRNSLVVGLAMGFAVIPNIFSIAEDAIYGVPRHLSQGSLALGATPWQTLWRVILLTASPGIFSAVMIGLGRAVGETMIVLMATGNTPVMDFSIFQGMRTLSANIAVEMPESEVASTHFRLLFLAALVLFMFTFLFNTVAEVVRQRLRKKYSNL